MDATTGRHGRGTARLAAALIAAALASGCDDKQQQAASSFDTTAHARRVAEEGILARVGRRGAVLRAVQVYRQALAGTVTVCGQINPSGRGDDAYVPFVSIVTYEEVPEQGQPRFQLVQHLADSSAAATRVYVEMVSRCFEGGGPRDARTVQTLPPLPSGLPHASDLPHAGEEMPALPPGLGQQPAASAAPTAAATTAVTAPPLASSRSNVTTRQHANLRASPAGGGAVLRVVPPASSLRVFGEAPGGWYQVGDTEPWGWIHGSLLDP